MTGRYRQRPSSILTSGEHKRRRSISPSSRTAAARLRQCGVVQSVGFRPFVYSLAQRHGLTGGLVPVNDGGVSLGQAAVAGYTALRRRGEL